MTGKYIAKCEYLHILVSVEYWYYDHILSRTGNVAEGRDAS
jgi:hypothetical protein